MRLVEEFSKFVVVVFPNDVNVVLAVDINGGPVAVLGTTFDNGVVDRCDGPIVGSHTVQWSVERRKCGVHDGVLPCLVSPYNVDAVVFIDRQVWVPNLVKARIGDLGCIDEGLATR